MLGKSKIDRNQSNMGSKDRWFAAISVFVGIGLSIIGVEVLLRLFAPIWLEWRMTYLNPAAGNARVGTDLAWPIEKRNGAFVRFVPNSQFDVAHLEYRTTAHIDELGGRVVCGTQAGGPIVPFVGASFTFGVGVDDCDTFASVAASALPRMRIVNLGVPGSALTHQLAWVRLRHQELGKPTQYVFFFSMRNMIDEKSRTEIAGTTEEERERALWWRINKLVNENGVLRRSYLIQFVRRFVLQVHNYFQASAWPDLNPIFLVMDRSNRAYYDAAENALDEQLVELSAMQEELGFTSTIISIPDVYQIDRASRHAAAVLYGYDPTRLDPDRPTQLLKAKVVKANIFFFDSTDCLRAASDHESLYYRQDNHFTQAGNRVFAKCVIPLLKARLR